jgi:hypothetical protein
MKILDKTPFRAADGTIDIMGRAQGTLKFGLSWYARLQAQDVVIAVMEKVLGENFILLRNLTLPDTDIDLPLVLIGPPGLFLVNVIHERGVYRARDDEWGTVAGDKLVPASINQLQRTVKLGRVLQIYLDRAGFKGKAVVDPILLAADPGMHIESVRPAARIVMSDALERFAISMNQARPVLNGELIGKIAKVIITGPDKKSEVPAGAKTIANPAPVNLAASSTPTPAFDARDTNEVLFDDSHQQAANSDFSAETLSFSFDDSSQETQIAQPQRAPSPAPAAPPSPEWQNTPTLIGSPSGFMEQRDQTGAIPDKNFGNADFGDADLRNAVFQDDAPQTFDSQSGSATFQFSENTEQEQNASQPGAQGKSVAARKKGLFGIKKSQLIILGGILLVWLCIMVGFAVYIYYSMYA